MTLKQWPPIGATTTKGLLMFSKQSKRSLTIGSTCSDIPYAGHNAGPCRTFWTSLFTRRLFFPVSIEVPQRLQLVEQL